MIHENHIRCGIRIQDHLDHPMTAEYPTKEETKGSGNTDVGVQQDVKMQTWDHLDHKHIEAMRIWSNGDTTRLGKTSLSFPPWDD